MSLRSSRTGTLFSLTGVLHCTIGLLIPELSQPLFRTIADLSVETSDLTERYARECTVWFQFSGLMMILCGQMFTKQLSTPESETFLGWSLVSLGAGLAIIMPVSGAWLILAQGIRVLYLNESPSESKRVD